MTGRAYYVEATGTETFRAYVDPPDLLAEIRRLFARGFVKVNAQLEPEQAAGSGALARARAALTQPTLSAPSTSSVSPGAGLSDG